MPENNKDQEMNNLQWESFFKKSETNPAPKSKEVTRQQEPQTNEGVTEEMVKAGIRDILVKQYGILMGQWKVASEIHQQFIQPLQKQLQAAYHMIDGQSAGLYQDKQIIEELEEQVLYWKQVDQTWKAQISSLQAEVELLKKQLEEKTLSNPNLPTK